MSLRDTLRGTFVKPYEQIDALEAKGRMDSDAILIDVREPQEWQAGHAQGARHIPLAQLDQRQRELPTDRPIITVCRSGARSARAASLLAEQGREVSNLRGGMRAWVAGGLPLVAKGGRQGAVI
jgi:rhodanese-related sulfurtransferase